MLAVVHAQSELGLDTTEPEARDAISTALGDVGAEYQVRRAIAPGAKGTDRYKRRIDLLVRALDALNELALPHVKFHVALRSAIGEGRAPEGVPTPPPAPELGPGPRKALGTGEPEVTKG